MQICDLSIIMVGVAKSAVIEVKAVVITVVVKVIRIVIVEIVAAIVLIVAVAVVAVQERGIDKYVQLSVFVHA